MGEVKANAYIAGLEDSAYSKDMQRWAASALVVVLVLWIGSPALACLARPEKMTEAEMQCCREMAGHCGEMSDDVAAGMSGERAHHSCCPKTPAKVQTSKKVVLAANEKVSIAAPLLVLHSVATPLIALRIERMPADSLATSESPPGAFTQLRI